MVAAGIIVFGLTFVDIAGSLLSDEGNGGVLTGRGARFVWRGLDRRRRRGRHWSSHVAGRIIVLAIPLSWLIAMWCAWVLVFASSAGNVVASSDRAPASMAEKVYYVGYLLVTLGNGEYQPARTVWQLASVAASITGFAVLTLGVTFIVPVVQAATTRRRTAALIALQGTTIPELREALESPSFDAGSIAHEIVTLTEEHGAFPVLHFLHTRSESRSAPAMIARLALASRGADVPAELERALDGYLQFHPGVVDSSCRTTWIDVLRSDGRAVPSSE